MSSETSVIVEKSPYASTCFIDDATVLRVYTPPSVVYLLGHASVYTRMFIHMRVFN